MHTGRLRVFLRVVERRSLSEAARELHLTQPSVSASIKQLEREWGTKLLQRHGRRGIQPTEAGRVLYDRSLELLRLIDRIRQELQQAARGERAQITTAICLGPLHTFPPLLRRFREEHPDIAITWKAGQVNEVLEWVRDGTAHLGLTWAPVATDTFSAEPLGWLRFKFFTSHKHPLAGRLRPLSLSTLSKHEFVVDQINSSTSRYLKSLLESHGIEDYRFFEVGNLMAVKETVLAGMGIGFASEPTIARESHSGLATLLDVEDVETERQLLLIRLISRGADPALDKVVDFLLRHGGNVTNV